MVLVSLVAFVTACAGVGPGGGGPTVEGGSLRVVIEGVPAGLPANVTVAGPDGVVGRASTTTTFEALAPGTYEVIAYPVGGVVAGYVPTEGARTVTVTASFGSEVRVLYASLPVVVPERSRPVDAETAALLVGAGGSGVGLLSVATASADTGGVLQFAASSPYLEALEPGHVVTLGVTPFTPQGFLGAVRSVEQVGESVIVVADPATIDDAVEQGVVAFAGPLLPSDVVAARGLVPGVDPMGVGVDSGGREFCPIDGGLSLLDPPDVLSITGTLCFTLDVDFSVTVRVGAAPSISFVVTATERATTRLTGTAALLAFEKEVQLVEYVMAPITVMVGVVPVVLTPVIGVSVDASGALVASFSTGLEQALTFRAGLELEHGEWREVIPTVSPTFTFTPPTFDGGLRVSSGMTPSVGLRLYGVVGPKLQMSAKVRADVDPVRQPAWRLHFGFEVGAGVEFTVLRFIDVSFRAELFEYEWLVAQAPTEPPPAVLTLAPSRFELAPTATRSVTATLTGTSDDRVGWSASCGAVSGAGLQVTYTAPADAGTCTLTAWSVAVPTARAIATVDVVAPPSSIGVVIEPPTATVPPSGSVGFAATVTGGTASAVTWSTTCGVLTPQGNAATFTAPTAGPLTCSVRATSVVDPSRFGVATVNVTSSAPPPWRFAPDTLQFSSEPGAAAPPAQSFVLHNDADVSRSFSLSAPVVSLVPSAGTLGPGGSVVVSASVPACSIQDGPGSVVYQIVETATDHGGSAYVVRQCGAIAGVGRLRVEISGLPEGVGASVVVTGPSDVYRPVASVELADVVVGTYQVVASAVEHGGGTYEPTVPVPAVTVTEGQVSTVGVVYAAPAVVVDVRPGTATVAAGARLGLSATVSGTMNVGVAWSATCGSIVGTGATIEFVAPNAAATCIVTATSLSDSSRFDTATVTVLPPEIVVTVSPTDVTLEPYESFQFSASVSGAANTAVTWSVSSPTCGNVSSAGLYTAPPGPMACTVIARSFANPSRSASASVAVGWSGEPVWRAEPTAVAVAGLVGGAAPAPVEFRLYNDGGSPGTFFLTADTFASVSPTTGTVGTASYALITVNVGACDAVGTSDAYVDVTGSGSSTSVRVRRVCEAASAPPPVTRMPVAGYDHTLAVLANGTVTAWGRNPQGQLGDGSTATRNTPGPVTGVANVIAVAAGDHSLALTTAGRVWAWGINNVGQLGDGTTSNRTTPVLVPVLQGVVSVDAGYRFSLALTDDGRVWSWGAGASGQLGHGTTQNRSTPTAIPGLVNVVAIAAGELHALALLANGEVWAWGRNTEGQIGDGTTGSERDAPVRVAAVSNAVAIAAGGRHSMAVDADGRVWVWGANTYGQLGRGHTTATPLPEAITLAEPVSTIAAGAFHSLALGRHGTVFAWGRNDTGQVGDGTLVARSTPQVVSGLGPASAVAAGWGHSMAVGTGGQLWLWGQNGSGQLGDGSWSLRRTPIASSVGSLLLP